MLFDHSEPPMKWKAKSTAEAGEILQLLARQGEPLLKKLDGGEAYILLTRNAQNDEVDHEIEVAEEEHETRIAS